MVYDATQSPHKFVWIHVFEFYQTMPTIQELLDSIPRRRVDPWKSETFDLDQGGYLTDGQLKQMITLFSGRQTMKKVRIARCLDSSEKAMAFMEHLGSYSFTELTVDQCHVNDEVAIVIAKALQETSLTILHLQRNLITPRGVKYITNALSDCNLRALNLHGCPIGDDGIIHLYAALSDPTIALRELDIGSVRMTQIGLDAITKVLPRTKLTQLCIGGLTYAVGDYLNWVDFVKAASDTRTLNAMSIWHMDISDELLPFMNTFVSKHPWLEELTLLYVTIAPAGFVSFIHAANTSLRLSTLCFTGLHSIDNSGADHVMKIIRTHRCLRVGLRHAVRITSAKKIELANHFERLHGNRASILTALAGGFYNRRIGCHSTIKQIPVECLRNLATFL